MFSKSSFLRSTRQSVLLVTAFGASVTLLAQEANYTPHKVPPPAKGAEYLLPDGTIYIAGNDLVEPLMQKLNAIFTASHPGFKFKMDLISSGIAVAGVTSGKSAFGPTARDVTSVEKAAFFSRFGYEPVDVLVGWDNNPDVEHNPPAGKFPPGVWVNAANPTPALSLEQLAGILLSGSPKGDITRWSQIKYHEGPVGLNGEDFAKHQIHIYMPILHGLPVVATTREKLGGKDLQWSPRVEYLPGLEDVINAVANDPFGIALAGWFPVDVGWDRQQQLGSKIRLLPLSEDAESHVSHGMGELYPLAGGIRFLLNRKPGQPLEPWIKEYMELVLSKQGQDIIRDLTKTDGFLPLEPDDLAAERAKLD